MAPGLPFSLMSVLYTLWMYCSPSNIIDKEPRIFYFTVGIVFSNIAVSCAMGLLGAFSYATCLLRAVSYATCLLRAVSYATCDVT